MSSCVTNKTLMTSAHTPTMKKNRWANTERLVARGEIRGVPAEPSRAEPVVEAVVARGDFAAHPAQQQSTTQVGEQVTAQGIAASAKELGIALPPNSSLLGPFLEAVELAITYKRRAEAAEAALAQR